jgi:hypothetical protein
MNEPEDVRLRLTLIEGRIAKLERKIQECIYEIEQLKAGALYEIELLKREGN